MIVHNCIYLLVILCRIYMILSRSVCTGEDKFDEAIFQHRNKLQAGELKLTDNENYFLERIQRQVVQPKWLTTNDGSNSFIDSAVYVNKKNLQEAADVRAAIQKAINEDSYAVATSNPMETQAPMSSRFGIPQRPGLIPALMPLRPRQPLQPQQQQQHNRQQLNNQQAFAKNNMWNRWLQLMRNSQNLMRLN